MREAGVGYWKIDWGKRSRDAGWRQSITGLGAREAPDLVVEQAMVEGTLASAAVYRTYDVREHHRRARSRWAASRTCSGSRPRARRRWSTARTSRTSRPAPAARSASCGTRSPDPLPDGRQDHAFPPVGRDLKRRLDEVVRGVTWHRIAAIRSRSATATGVPRSSADELTDTWTLQADETWMAYHPGDRRTAKAPARIARGGLPLPEVDGGPGPAPPVRAGPAARPTGRSPSPPIGRTLDRSYVTPKARVTQDVGHADTVGVFGVFGKLTLRFDHAARPVPGARPRPGRHGAGRRHLAGVDRRRARSWSAAT